MPDLGIGVGLRTPHFRTSSRARPRWTGSRPSPRTSWTRGDGRSTCSTRWPSATRSSSTGCPFDRQPDRSTSRTSAAEALAARPRPWVSDHLCWTGVAGRNRTTCCRCPRRGPAHVPPGSRVQDVLGRPLVLENVSTYLTWRVDADRVGFPGAAVRRRTAGSCSTSTTSTCAAQPRLRPAQYLERCRPSASCRSTSPATRTAARTSSTPTTARCRRRCGTSTPPLRAPAAVSTLLEWDAVDPAARRRAGGGREGAPAARRGERATGTHGA